MPDEATSAQVCGELLQLSGGVEQLAVAEVRPPGAARAVVHPDGTGLGEPLFDTVPRWVAKVEGVPDRRIGGAEEKLEEALVTWPFDDDADATQPVTEGANPGLEGVEPALDPIRRLDRESEAVGHLRRPRAELLLRREAGTSSR